MNSYNVGPRTFMEVPQLNSWIFYKIEYGQCVSVRLKRSNNHSFHHYCRYEMHLTIYHVLEYQFDQNPEFQMSTILHIHDG